MKNMGNKFTSQLKHHSTIRNVNTIQGQQNWNHSSISTNRITSLHADVLASPTIHTEKSHRRPPFVACWFHSKTVSIFITIYSCTSHHNSSTTNLQQPNSSSNTPPSLYLVVCTYVTNLSSFLAHSRSIVTHSYHVTFVPYHTPSAPRHTTPLPNKTRPVSQS